jgi:hypothetical protein
MNRWKAATIHLAISIVLAATIAALLYCLWFPSPYFIAAGASRLILVLMGVDIGIGPLLTLIAVSPNKSRKLLRLDLSIIASMQTIAFAYGIHVIAAARPVFVVAAVDRLVLVTAEELADADLTQGHQPAFRARSWTGPILVGALPPKGGADIHIVEQAMGGGKDIDQLPGFYVPYDQVVDKLMQHAKPLSQTAPATPGPVRWQDIAGTAVTAWRPRLHSDHVTCDPASNTHHAYRPLVAEQSDAAGTYSFPTSKLLTALLLLQMFTHP